MSVVALSPVAARPFPSAAAASSLPHPPLVASPKDIPVLEALLNAVKVGESLQKIRYDVRQLLLLTASFTPCADVPTDMSTGAVTEDELRAMLKLSKHITSKLDKITALRDKQLYKECQDAITRDAGQACPTKQSRKRKTLQLACHICAAVNTPQWRTGKDGPRTLCNVCGLMYAKKKHRIARRGTRPLH